MTERSYTYSCLQKEVRHFPAPNDPVWDGLPRMELLNTVTGLPPGLATTVEAFRDGYSIFFRFICQDDHIVSTLYQHDDPIYTEDVVEVFITETGSGQDYKEFENSPANVQFDAVIRYDGPDQIEVHREWDASGWRTEVYHDQDRSIVTYVWELPFVNFTGGAPRSGGHWLMNCYRIDRGRNGSDEYSAWSPTEELNFHVPGKFGYLRFE